MSNENLRRVKETKNIEVDVFIVCRENKGCREILGRDNKNQRIWISFDDSTISTLEAWTDYHMALNTVVNELPLYEETDAGCNFIPYEILKVKWRPVSEAHTID